MIHKLLSWLLFFLVLGTYVGAQDGKALFQGNCGSCHTLDKRVAGPPLRGVIDRWDGDIDEMVAFIKNPQAYANAGKKKSAHIKTLYDDYKIWMTPQAALGDESIKAILNYIKDAPAPAAAPTASASDASKGESGKSALSLSDSQLFLGLAVLVGLLLVVCVLLIIVVAFLVQANKAKEEGVPLTWDATSKTIQGFLSNKVVVTLIVLIVALVGFNYLVKTARGVGLRQGYMPAQPVAFSHKLHAGQYGIACQYCHVGVERGKNATIPSTNICMNCHNYIDQGPVHGKKEIAKIRESWETGKPIEWVKIHVLPDFVYFNHAQHVKVAGLACQDCHGPVETMEEVYQYNDLSMGWCINCHREKEVDLDKNEYYKTVHAKVKERLNNKELKKITVENLGGLECARCHY